MKELEEILKYEFKDINLLKTALTHSSYSNEHKCNSYERLEFLGDSVLGLIVSEYLFEQMKNINEGDLSRIRASLVCEESLAQIAVRMKLGNFIYLGRGEEKSGSRNRDSILSDVFEAVLAAIFLDSDMETAKKYLLMVMGDKLSEATKHKSVKDYKSSLQEAIQHITHGRTKIEYRTVAETGPEHNKKFVVDLMINEKKASQGKGFSKKEAEQQAAKFALAEKKYEAL